MLFDTFSAGSAIPEVANSLRFDGSNDYITKSYTNTTFTQAILSVWVKRSKLSTNQTIFCFGGTGTGYPGDYVYFDTSDRLNVMYDDSGNPPGPYPTTSVFRDTSSWYHIVIAWDTTQAVQVDRQKVWVNNVLQVTSNGLALNANLYLRSTPSLTTFGYRSYIGDMYFDGYLANACLVFGSGFTPSSFAYTEPTTGQWISKSRSALASIVSTGGANSFFLPFDNGASTVTLGYDASSKANNWTLNNMVRTNSVSDCWTFDTPTNNHATLNHNDKYAGSVISNGGLTQTAYSGYRAAASIRIPTGSKIYTEFINSSAHNSNIGIGFGVSPDSVPNSGGYNATGSYHMYASNGAYISNNGTLIAIASETNVANQTYQVAADASNGKVWIGQNNVWWDSTGGSTGNPSTGANPTFTIDSSGFKIFSFIDSAGSVSWDANFGQRAFNFTPPTGFKTLCTKNLPTPAIPDPKKHFDIKLRTGTGANQNITGIPFKPDLVWTKARSTAYNAAIYDAVRGATKFLIPSLTDTEYTNVTALTAFNSDGFSVGTDSSNAVNAAGISYVDWLWKAGGTPVTNTSGTITSQVSANQQAGFSIVTYTGNANLSATVGHGLGVAPALVIVKLRSGAGGSWQTYHRSIGPSVALYLDLTLSSQTSSGFWNNTPPTTSVISIGNSGSTNVSAGTHVAYCFAEIPGFSKIGSYVGDGSSDGPFVYCGFKPKFVMIKRTDSVGDWYLVDAGRNPTNLANLDHRANTTAAEGVGSLEIDFTSNGFKLRNTNTWLNGATGTYIFYAVAEAPFKYANAR